MIILIFNSDSLTQEKNFLKCVFPEKKFDFIVHAAKGSCPGLVRFFYYSSWSY